MDFSNSNYMASYAVSSAARDILRGFYQSDFGLSVEVRDDLKDFSSVAEHQIQRQGWTTASAGLKFLRVGVYDDEEDDDEAIVNPDGPIDFVLCSGLSLLEIVQCCPALKIVNLGVDAFTRSHADVLRFFPAEALWLHLPVDVDDLAIAADAFKALARNKRLRRVQFSGSESPLVTAFAEFLAARTGEFALDEISFGHMNHSVLEAIVRVAADALQQARSIRFTEGTDANLSSVLACTWKFVDSFVFECPPLGALHECALRDPRRPKSITFELNSQTSPTLVAQLTLLIACESMPKRLVIHQYTDFQNLTLQNASDLEEICIVRKEGIVSNELDKSLSTGLQQFRSLRTLEIHNFALPRIVLALSIVGLPRLTRLSLRSCVLDASVWKCLGGALAMPGPLEHLDLHATCPSSDGSDQLVLFFTAYRAQVRRNSAPKSSLKELILTDCYWSFESIDALFDFISRPFCPPRLRRLDLSGGYCCHVDDFTDCIERRSYAPVLYSDSSPHLSEAFERLRNTVVPLAIHNTLFGACQALSAELIAMIANMAEPALPDHDTLMELFNQARVQDGLVSKPRKRARRS